MGFQVKCFPQRACSTCETLAQTPEQHCRFPGTAQQQVQSLLYCPSTFCSITPNNALAASPPVSVGPLPFFFSLWLPPLMCHCASVYAGEHSTSLCTTPVASPRTSKSCVLCTSLWSTFSWQEEERTLQGNTVLGTKLEREKPESWSRTKVGLHREIGTTTRQTTAKHQRCQQLDLLKGKGTHAMEAESIEQLRNGVGRGWAKLVGSRSQNN